MPRAVVGRAEDAHAARLDQLSLNSSPIGPFIALSQVRGVAPDVRRLDHRDRRHPRAEIRRALGDDVLHAVGDRLDHVARAAELARRETPGSRCGRSDFGFTSAAMRSIICTDGCVARDDVAPADRYLLCLRLPGGERHGEPD